MKRNTAQRSPKKYFNAKQGAGKWLIQRLGVFSPRLLFAGLSRVIRSESCSVVWPRSGADFCGYSFPYREIEKLLFRLSNSHFQKTIHAQFPGQQVNTIEVSGYYKSLQILERVSNIPFPHYSKNAATIAHETDFFSTNLSVKMSDSKLAIGCKQARAEIDTNRLPRGSPFQSENIHSSYPTAK
ncbi:hypothetical protein [Blastopirellula marina]|uniref:hypothetical protein n=1 Tax=Blastopirellula marina TaxID=124 RepID=UPI0011B09832|nr:hypothetical protein [Blastopirellula marina]